MKNWELSFGFYPGILIGFRTYNEEDRNNHVLYIQTAREELEDNYTYPEFVNKHYEKKD